MNNQFKLGVFILIGFFAIIVSIIAIEALSLKSTHDIYVKFDNISGLTRKAKVKISGVDVGILKSISLDNSKAKLKLSINKKVILYQNLSVRIVSSGIIGTKYIEIIPGDASYGVFKGGDYILTGQNQSLESILTNIFDNINKALGDDRHGGMIINLSDAIHSLKNILDSFASQDDMISKIINNFNKFSADLAIISMYNKQDLRDIILSVKNIVTTLDILIASIRDGNSIISSLISDEQMGKDLKETVASARETIKNFSDKIKKTDKFHLNWEIKEGYNFKNRKLISDVGINVMPDNNKFYYIGLSNVGDSCSVLNDNDRDNANKLEALLGFIVGNAEIYGGLIKGKAGFGFGYYSSKPIYTQCKGLQAHLNIRDFSRDKYGPTMDIGVRFGIEKYLSLGVAVEDITHSIAVKPYIRIAIDDKDLASLLGIANIATAVSK
ncbi:MAG: MlaD family protein [Endomicrobium sp.]|jgi:phospholipid/cholesterol/gamma-HCH transport system substrate-binding protein|nr:MlaD family protein [Endomicrobium sp.]